MPMTAAQFAATTAKAKAGSSFFAAYNAAIAAESPAQKAARNKAQIANTYAGGGGFKSVQHDIAVDQAQRIAGLNPEDALRGPRFLQFGGKTFQSGAGDMYGTFTGDFDALKQQFADSARGGDFVAGVLQLNEMDEEEAAGIREEFGMRKDSGGISMRRYLNRRLAQLTDTQREEVLGASGLSVDQFASRFGTGQQHSTLAETGAEVQGFDPNAYQLGTHRLKESIGQAQASRGLYGSLASAAAEARAVSALQGAQRQATNPFLVSGTVDEQRAGVPGFFNMYGAGAGQNQQYAYGQGYFNEMGQWVSGGTMGLNFGQQGDINYQMNNPLAFLGRAGSTYAAAFGQGQGV